MLNKTDVSMLYITIMGMASEGDGNKYWLDYANNNSLGVSSLANIMLDSPGAAKFFGDSLLAGNEKDFVTKIYSIALGNTSDVDGINYWTKAITGGGEFTDSKGNVISVASLSKGDLIGAMINSMVNGGSAESKAIFEAKAAASDYFADATLGKDISGLDEGTTSKLISEINSASDLDKVKSEIDGLKESIDEAGLNKIALTTENDTITGTEGGDLISGVVGTAAESTLNPGDKIDGGAGNDVLKVDLKNNFKGLKDDGYIKNIEKLSLTNSSVSNRTFDAKGIDGLQTVALSGEKGISVTNLANIVDVEVNGFKGTNFNVDSIYADKVLDGSADVQNLKVNGVGAKGASVAITADKIETLNLNTTGSQSFVSADVASISVKGNANLSLATGAKTTTLDASSFGGALDADLSTSASVTSIKGGNGNDKITIKDVAVNVAIDGGAGNDELVIKGSTADTLQPTLTNIEKVTIDGNTKDLTLSLKKAQSVTELSFKNIAKTVTESNGNVETVNILANNATDKAVTINDESLKTINFSDVDDKGASVAAKGKIVADKATELTINSNKVTLASDAVVQAANATKIDINAAKDTVGLTLGGVAKLTDLTVNNKGAFALTGANATDLDSVKNLSVNTEGAFSIATATSLKNLNNLSLNGVSADLNSVNVGTATLASLEANINVSGEFKLGTTTAKGDVDFNIENVGALTLGAITSSTGNASVIISSATGNVTLGAVSATQGNLTLNAGNTLGNITIGALKGDIVSVDLGGVLGTINSDANNKVSITSNEVTYVGSEISKNVVEITAAAGGTDLNAQVIGGAAADDALTIIGKGDTQTITASGDLSGGTLTLTLTEATKLSSLDISGVKGLSAATAIDLKNVSVENKLIVDIQGSDAAETITANSTSATLTAITLSGDLGGGANTVTVAPDAAAVAITTIDLSGLSATGGTLSGTITHNAAQTALTTIKGSAGNDTITIGIANADLTVTGGAGNDVFNVTAAKIVTANTPEHATITDFSAGDSIKFAASVTAYKHSTVDLSGKADLKSAIAAVLTDSDEATTVYGFTYNNESYLYYNVATTTATAAANDVLVKLTGTTVDLDSLTVTNNDIVFA
ncbi:beta strand repeat-containing protein [Campylobacter fetus]|uniref:Surface array protein n=2 Tax=Campylobacter fetus TaxID=196 RepID=Q841Z0_CAMFE|nr:surface array protein [Campylobacter fetus]AAO64211.1 surface array protein [Campylobacter fetus]ABK82228.1 surface array protein [Campylobacter fetus subsp. fetus 82-40]ABK82782.1 surface array protein [Campylobacter fetus subsp. fetus 82-40]AHE93805.1 surface array protein A [Campylobacter fetus subsp. venerealis cfvi03/293]AHE93822.1 surface array protein A [Campylobacter fetus subsp. venerealis cfvi03/293]